jgi:hypothetical protein
MMQARWVNRIGLAGAVALAALVAGAPVGAQAQDDAVEPNSIWNLDQRIWGGVVRGLGLRDPNAPEIDYRERSPLVVPPSSDLPPPQAKATPKSGAWPKDPDAARARKAQEAKRRNDSNARTAVENQGRPITPSELDKGAVTGSVATSGRSNAPAPGSDPDGRQVNPSELGYFGGLFSGRAWGFGFGGYKDETGTFTNEPPRTQLTEPPPGYQTPSAAQPYGVTRRIENTPIQPHDPAGRDYGR